MRPKIGPIIKLLLLLIVIIASIYYISHHANDFKKISDLGIAAFLALSALTLVMAAIFGRIYRSAFAAAGVRLGAGESFGLAALGVYVNHLVTKSAFFTTGRYLDKFYTLSYARTFLVFLMISLVQVLCYSAMALVAILASAVKPDNNILLVFFAGLFIISLVPFLIPAKKIHPTLDGWSALTKSGGAIGKIALLSFASIVTGGTKIFIIYMALYKNADFANAMLMSATGALSLFISITPASLGIREALMSYAAALTGSDFTRAAVVSTVDRAVGVVWIFALGFAASLWYSRKLSRGA